MLCSLCHLSSKNFQHDGVCSMKNEYEIVPYSKLRHINIFLINITYRNYHMHNEIEIFAVIKGSATIRRNSGTTEIKPGSIVILNSGEAHEIDASGGSVTAIVLQVSSHFLRDYFPRFHNTRFGVTDISASVPGDILRKMWSNILSAAEYYIRGEELFELRCVAHTAGLLSQLISQVPNEVISESEYLVKKKITQRMSRLYSYIDENYQYPIRLADVAKTEDITPTHLSHFFSENFGISFQQYLSNLRFEHAVRLMDDHSLSISDVAAASGFSDLKYMTQMFLHYFGCRPKEFREHLNTEAAGQLNSAPRNLLEFYYSNEQSLVLLSEFIAGLPD